MHKVTTVFKIMTVVSDIGGEQGGGIRRIERVAGTEKEIKRNCDS